LYLFSCPEGSVDRGKVLANEHISLDRMKLTPSSVLLLARGQLPTQGLASLTVMLRTPPPELAIAPSVRSQRFRDQAMEAAASIQQALGAPRAAGGPQPDSAVAAVLAKMPFCAGKVKAVHAANVTTATGGALIPLWDGMEFSVDLPLSDLLDALRSHPMLSHVPAESALRVRVLRRSDQPGAVVACLDKPLKSQGVNVTTAGGSRPIGSDITRDSSVVTLGSGASAGSAAAGWAQLVVEVLVDQPSDTNAAGGPCGLEATPLRMYTGVNMFPGLSLSQLNAVRADFDHAALLEWQQMQAVKREVQMVRAELAAKQASSMNMALPPATGAGPAPVQSSPPTEVKVADAAAQGTASATVTNDEEDDVFTSTFSQVRDCLCVLFSVKHR